MAFRRAILGSLVALTIVGCERSGEVTEPLAEWTEQSASLSVASSQDLAPYHSVAHAIALALDDDVVRRQLLQSMRSSKYSERKLVLQHFLKRAESSSLRTAVADGLGGTDNLLSQLAAELPGEVDFYAPSREQRRAWTGSDEVLVAAIGDSDSEQALAFATNGTSQIITGLDNPGIEIVFVIHPAEVKNEYPNRDLGGGDRIEDPPVPGALFKTCNDPETCGGGGGGGPPPPPPPPGTYETSIYPCFGDGIFSGEPEIFFITGDDYGAIKQTPTVSVIPFQLNYVRLKIFDSSASSSHRLVAVLWEDDSGFLDQDDEKGQAIIFGDGVYASIDAYGHNYDGCSNNSLPAVWAEYTVGTGG